MLKFRDSQKGMVSKLYKIVLGCLIQIELGSFCLILHYKRGIMELCIIKICWEMKERLLITFIMETQLKF